MLVINNTKINFDLSRVRNLTLSIGKQLIITFLVHGNWFSVTIRIEMFNDFRFCKLYYSKQIRNLVFIREDNRKSGMSLDYFAFGF